MKKYDVIIVGGGPAGIFAALELVQVEGLSVLLIEKGRDIGERNCPVRGGSRACTGCQPCNIVCGLGGAGAFSDGKLVFSAEVGGYLEEYLGRGHASRLIGYVDELYLRFGAAGKLFGAGDEAVAIAQRATAAGLRLIPSPVRHMGTENCYAVLTAMRDYLRLRLEIRLRCMVSRILVEDGGVSGVEMEDGERIYCRYLILAPGREGADWFSREAQRLKLTIRHNPIDVGVRVEVPFEVMKDITDALYEVKLEYISPSFRDRIRTFCMCPAGEVITETTGGADPVVTVNGHSYAGRKTPNTNFAILVSTNFTYPFREPIAYGKYVAKLANLLGGGVLLQRFGDLLQGRRSTDERIASGRVSPTLKSATPGDVSFALPYRHLTGITEMLRAMDRMAPGVGAPDTLLYGIEVKFYSFRPLLTSCLETEVKNMFAVGDGAGVSRGLVQASASGLVAAVEILRRLGAVSYTHL
ncbi:MAG: NAD(P)/FAD-dependent oxidoreductase, partial [Dehalococcoidales bacterium]|nr:NAD(P)/FAD-dependent oxidoreductase [Dehalococcoidales bacterium]